MTSLLQNRLDAYILAGDMPNEYEFVGVCSELNLVFVISLKMCRIHMEKAYNFTWKGVKLHVERELKGMMMSEFPPKMD